MTATTQNALQFTSSIPLWHPFEVYCLGRMHSWCLVMQILRKQAHMITEHKQVCRHPHGPLLYIHHLTMKFIFTSCRLEWTCGWGRYNPLSGVAQRQSTCRECLFWDVGSDKTKTSLGVFKCNLMSICIWFPFGPKNSTSKSSPETSCITLLTLHLTTRTLQASLCVTPAEALSLI